MEKARKSNLGEPRCQEKRRSHAIWCPYRKPTQVDEERILRRPDECSLRNSAKKQVYLRYIPCLFACWVQRNNISLYQGVAKSGKANGSVPFIGSSNLPSLIKYKLHKVL